MKKSDDIWNRLKLAWRSYKSYRMNDNKLQMIIKAKEIRKLQREMGCTRIDEFPEIGCFTSA